MVIGRKRVLAACVALLLTLGLVSGVSAAPKELRMGYLVADQIHGAALMVMKERKMLEAAGYTVKWSEYLAGGYFMQDMAAGAIDYGVTGVVPAMITHAQGIKVAVLASSNTEGSSLVVQNSIKTVKDLDGKKIGTPGVGSMQDAMVAQLAADHKIKIRRMNIKVSDMPLFLQKKEIDGFCAWAPHPTRAVALGYGHQLLTSHDMRPGHQCCVLVTTVKTMQADPETAKTVVKVYLDAYKWLLNNREEAMGMMAKATAMDGAIVREAIKLVQYSMPPYCDMPSIKSLAVGLIETDKITNVKADQVDAFVADIYRPELVEQLTETKAPR